MKTRRYIVRLGVAVALLAALAVGGTMVLAAEEPAKSVATEAPAAVPPAPAQTAAAAPAPPKPDPSGAATGGIGDIPAKVAGKPTLEEVADTVGHNKIAINMMWTLVAGFLVMFMQAGFALAETGLTRAKNAAHTMMMNMMVFCIGAVGYWLVGFAFQFGGINAAYPAVTNAWATAGDWAIVEIMLGTMPIFFSTAARSSRVLVLAFRSTGLIRAIVGFLS